MDLISLGEEIAKTRKSFKLSQATLAGRAGISRATLDALENGRSGEVGYSKITKLLNALGLELKLQPASSQRPTLDQLLQENQDDKRLNRRN